MKVIISKTKEGKAVAKNEQGQVVGRFAASWPGGTFTQAADALAGVLLAKCPDIKIDMGDMPMFEQERGVLIWSAFDAGLSA